MLANSYERKLRADLSVLHFFWIRLVRLYPLYIAGITIGCAAGWLAGVDAIHTLLYICPALLFLPSPVPGAGPYPLDGPTWSLFFELVANYVYARLLRLLTARVIIFVLLGCALALAVAIYLSADRTIDVGWSKRSFIGGFPRVGFSFFAGVIMGRYYMAKRSAISLNSWYGPYVPWALLVAIGLILTATPSSRLQPFFDFAAVTLMFPAVVFTGLWFQPGEIGQRFFKFLGTVSYAIYVLHLPLAKLINGILMARGGIAVAHCAPWSGAVSLAGLASIGWGLDRAYDRPIRRVLSRLYD